MIRPAIEFTISCQQADLIKAVEKQPLSHMYHIKEEFAAPFFRAYSVSVFEKCQLVKMIPVKSKLGARTCESITQDIRKMTDLLVPSVSIAANLEFEKIGVNPFRMTWQDQPKFDPERKTFVLEHFWPAFEIRKMCLASGTLSEVEDILRTKPKVVWLLREEDKRLTDGGYKKNRPGPLEAYHAAGIKILDES